MFFLLFPLKSLICLNSLNITREIWKWCLWLTEAATRGVLRKKVFLETSQNSQENTCVTASGLITLKIEKLASTEKNRSQLLFTLSILQIKQGFKDNFDQISVNMCIIIFAKVADFSLNLATWWMKYNFLLPLGIYFRSIPEAALLFKLEQFFWKI